MTVSEVAELYGITRQRVHQIAKARGIAGRRIGTTYVYTFAQAEKLRPRPTGRPRKDRS